MGTKRRFVAGWAHLFNLRSEDESYRRFITRGLAGTGEEIVARLNRRLRAIVEGPD